MTVPEQRASDTDPTLDQPPPSMPKPGAAGPRQIPIPPISHPTSSEASTPPSESTVKTIPRKAAPAAVPSPQGESTPVPAAAPAEAAPAKKNLLGKKNKNTAPDAAPDAASATVDGDADNAAKKTPLSGLRGKRTAKPVPAPGTADAKRSKNLLLGIGIGLLATAVGYVAVTQLFIPDQSSIAARPPEMEPTDTGMAPAIITPTAEPGLPLPTGGTSASMPMPMPTSSAAAGVPATQTNTAPIDPDVQVMTPPRADASSATPRQPGAAGNQAARTMTNTPTTPGKASGNAGVTKAPRSSNTASTISNNVPDPFKSPVASGGVRQPAAAGRAPAPVVTAAPITVPVAAVPAPVISRTNTPAPVTPIPAPVTPAPAPVVQRPPARVVMPTPIPAPRITQAPPPAPAPVPVTNVPVTPGGAPTSLVVVEEPKLNALEQWIADNQVTFKGVASSGMKTIVVLGTKLGDYEAEVGQVIPETKIRIDSADNAHLKLISGTLSKKMSITGETTQ